MPPTSNDEVKQDVNHLTLTVGRLSGAVEALTSRLNRTDDFIDSHFRDLTKELKDTLIPLATRVTIIEAQRGRIAIPASVFGAVVGAITSGFIVHFWG